MQPQKKMGLRTKNLDLMRFIFFAVQQQKPYLTKNADWL